MNRAPQPPLPIKKVPIDNENVWEVNTTNFEKTIKTGNKNTRFQQKNLSWAAKPIQKSTLPPLPPSPKEPNGNARKSRKARKARKTRRQRK